MIAAKVTFGTQSGQSRDELWILAEEYLYSLLSGGNLYEGFLLTWSKGKLIAYVNLAGMGGQSLLKHIKESRKHYRNLIAAFGQKPSWVILDDDYPTRPPTWKNTPFLVLFTNFLDIQSPVCRGDNGKVIPLFRLPINPRQLQAIYFWQKDYRAYDNLWFSSGPLEMRIYRQMADPNSKLSLAGKKCCLIVEKATDVPTYYYLHRYYGRSQGEENRLCPGCGKDWKKPFLKNGSQDFWSFPFQCHSCRLVSTIGTSTDGGRNTKIGEYQPPESKPKP